MKEKVLKELAKENGVKSNAYADIHIDYYDLVTGDSSDKVYTIKVKRAFYSISSDNPEIEQINIIDEPIKEINKPIESIKEIIAPRRSGRSIINYKNIYNDDFIN